MSKWIETQWSRFTANRDESARNRLLEQYIGLVHHAAREMIKAAPSAIELDDLISAGTVGLVQALEGFDPSRGFAFSTYAVPRIRGAMLDELRAWDWAPRSVRARNRKIDRMKGRLEQDLGRLPGDREVADALGIDLTTYWRWSTDADRSPVVMLQDSDEAAESGTARLIESVPDLEARPADEALARKEVIGALRSMIDALPAKDRLILALYYYEDLTQQQIGAVLRITESRVCQILSRATTRLRESLISMGVER